MDVNHNSLLGETNDKKMQSNSNENISKSETHSKNETQDLILAKTIQGFSIYLKKIKKLYYSVH